MAKKGVKKAVDALTWGATMKTAGSGAWKALTSKDTRDHLIGNAVSGLAWGAGVGGVAELAQGGSFWEGAKNGAITGGLIGVAGTGLGGAARAFDPTARGVRQTGSVLSKQLKAVMDHSKTTRVAKGVTSS